MESALEVENLRKHFKSGVRGIVVQALDGLSFSVERGSVFGLLGSNGAGKSTAIKIIMGLLRANSGEVRIFGQKISNAVKRRVGYLPESPNFYKFLSSYELVLFYARLCGLDAKSAAEASKKTLELVGLGDAMQRRLSGYSKGMLQRAGLAQAIVHNPDLVILDEPSSGLDPLGMADMSDMVRRLKDAGKTILLCSHQMSEVEALCDNILILNRGKVYAEGRLGELLKKKDSKVLEISGISQEAAAEAVAKAGGKVERAGDAKISLEEYFRAALERDLK